MAVLIPDEKYLVSKKTDTFSSVMKKYLGLVTPSAADAASFIEEKSGNYNHLQSYDSNSD